MATKVQRRMKQISGYRQSLYLDYYPAIAIVKLVSWHGENFLDFFWNMK